MLITIVLVALVVQDVAVVIVLIVSRSTSFDVFAPFACNCFAKVVTECRDKRRNQ